MHMPLNKAWAYNQSLCLDRFFAEYRLFGDDSNLPVTYADIANLIKVSLGVHDPAAIDHNIVMKKRYLRRMKGKQNEYARKIRG